ncbi:MAG: transketolase [Bacilli bacterium]|nr:transketolase [Bacilli bacterium]
MLDNIDSLSIATIRGLCIDMINKAKSGHPGVALGAAPILYTLYTRHLNATNKDPNWMNRDRFVLSAGHGSSLLYALLHLCGYKVSMDDIKSFRQLGSITPGHPEWGVTEGVDASTGPLGQGIALAVGMAIAEQMVANLYPHGDILCNHYTYALCGDGCLEEGISQEAISFAGLQKLNKLILLYDANNVTLDGKLDEAFNENTELRFKASGWDVLKVEDGNDVEAIDKAIATAKKSLSKPTLIIVNTIIGYGATAQGTNKVHGAPIGVEDGKKAKLSYGFDHEEFYVPEEVYKHFEATFGARGTKAYSDYQKEFVSYSSKYKDEAARFLKLKDNDVSAYLPKELPSDFGIEPLATRKVSQAALNDYNNCIPNLFGGAADVASSVMTQVKDAKPFGPNARDGHRLNFGIREFAMTVIQNGMLYHGGVRTFIGSFLAFSDYMKAGIRMATLSNLPAIYLFSHDSIAVGEDGPTHQPVEQVATLRLFPNLNVIRPCDARETYAAWQVALRSLHTPTALILSRQVLPQLSCSNAEGVYKGAYVISDNSKAKFIIIASGSEVDLALKAQKALLEKGIATRVVSMPSWELFEAQDDEYKAKVFNMPKDRRISVEMMSRFGWDQYADHHLSVDIYGRSAKASDVIKAYGFSVEHLVEVVEGLVK